MCPKTRRPQRLGRSVKVTSLAPAFADAATLAERTGEHPQTGRRPLVRRQHPTGLGQAVRHARDDGEQLTLPAQQQIDEIASPAGHGGHHRQERAVALHTALEVETDDVAPGRELFEDEAPELVRAGGGVLLARHECIGHDRATLGVGAPQCQPGSGDREPVWIDDAALDRRACANAM